MRLRLLCATAMCLSMALGAAPVLAQEEAVTLRLAVSDFPGQTSAPYVQTFIDEVATRSGGTVTVVPTFQPDLPATNPGFEQGVAKLLVDGQFELALAAARGWDSVGITSLEALQTPFLITDDALAKAVVSSPIVDDMLAEMTGGGVTGLAAWYEGLRHFLAYESCGGPFLRPADLAGRTIRGVPSAVTEQLLAGYGASLVLVNNPDWAARVATCDIDGAETPSGPVQDMSTTSVVTGDVVPYPKFQVLAANASAFEHLSDAQRTAIREAAAAAAQQGTAGEASEADLGTAVCESGGRVVMAGTDGIAAFEAGAKPVIDRLMADAATASAIAAIRELAKETEPAPGMHACEPIVVSEPSQSPRAVGTPASLPPTGTWRVELTDDEMLAAGAKPGNNVGGVITWTFAGDHATYQASYSDGGQEVCEAEMQPTGDLVRFVYVGRCAPEIDSIQWSLEDDGLHLALVDIAGQAELAWNQAYLRAKPWQRVE